MATNKKFVKNERCYVCDKIIKGKCIRLVAAIAPFSNTDLPTKIGQLMGDDFMVVVSVNDNICRRCASLLHELDRLEFSLNLVRTELTNYLTMKYQLDDNYHRASMVNKESSIAIHNNEKISEGVGRLTFKSMSTKRKRPQKNEAKNEFQDSPEILCKSVRYHKTVKGEVVHDDLLNQINMTVVNEERQKDVLSSENNKFKVLACVQATSNTSVNMLNQETHYFDMSNKKCKSTYSINEKTSVVSMGHTNGHQLQTQFKHELLNKDLRQAVSHMIKSNLPRGESEVDNINRDDEIGESQVHSSNRNITVSDVENYVCNFCSFSFDSSLLLEDHKKTHHTLVYSTIKEDSQHTKETANLNGEQTSHSSKGVSCRSQHILSETLSHNKVTLENIILKAKTSTKKHCNKVKQALGKIIPDPALSNKDEQHLLNSLKTTPIAVEKVVSEICNTNKIVSSSKTNIRMKNETQKPKENVACRLSCTDKPKLNCGSNLLQNTENNNNIEERRETEKEKEKYTKEMEKCNEESDATFIHDSQDFNKLCLSKKSEVNCSYCSKCQKLFTNKSDLNYHTEICLGNVSCNSNEKLLLNETDPQYHAYEDCNTYKTNTTLKKSIDTCLSNEPHQVLEHNLELSVCCEQCGEVFSTADQLKSHKAAVHRDLHCRYCGKEILKLKALRNHELRHMRESGEKYECGECKKIFKTKIGLHHHSAIHTGQYKYVCSYCGRGFTSRMMLEEHRSKHTKEERYICDVCGRGFCFQSTYWIHRKWHDNPFPYKCNFCGRKFKHTSLLAVHKRKHTGERPYKCPYCPRTFTVGGTMKRHIILHTGVYPYNCELCKRGFTTRHKYALHLSKIHGDSKMLTKKLQPRDFKMVIRDDELIEDKGIMEPSADWQNSEDVTFKLVDPTITEDNYEHLDGTMACSLVPGVLTTGNMLPSRVVEIVLEEASQAVATVTVSNTESNSLTDLWYR